MKIPPGQYIPFWFKLWDGNPSDFILAHLTDTSGIEQAGSPYALTYSGNRGIYTGLGPQMGTANLVVDYETYADSAHTRLDGRYLPAAEWVQPDLPSPPSFILLNRPLAGTIVPNTIRGSISCEVEAGARIAQDKLLGFVSTPLLTGSVSAVEIQESL